MRRRALLPLVVVGLLLFSGCAAAPEPKPSRTPSATASATPTPTPEPIVAPTPAFDVTCDDVAAAVEELVGPPNTDVSHALSLVSGPRWYPGPAQYMFDRAGGIACSAGDSERSWQITMVPGATSIVEGAASRDGFSGENFFCDNSYDFGSCIGDVVEGDVLLSLQIVDPALSAGATGEVETVFRTIAAKAAAKVRPVQLADSAIVGVACSRFLTEEEIRARVGDQGIRLTEKFGGWGIPAEVYFVVNGAKVCQYSSGGFGDGTTYLTITTLPGGAWAFEQIAGATAITVDGADAALSGVDPLGRPVLDLRLGADWIRLTMPEDGVVDLLAIAPQIVKNFTVGRPAPQ